MNLDTTIAFLEFFLPLSFCLIGICMLRAFFDPGLSSPFEIITDTISAIRIVFVESAKIVGTSLFVLIFLPLKLLELQLAKFTSSS